MDKLVLDIMKKNVSALAVWAILFFLFFHHWDKPKTPETSAKSGDTTTNTVYHVSGSVGIVK